LRRRFWRVHYIVRNLPGSRTSQTVKDYACSQIKKISSWMLAFFDFINNCG
jgi:hypothetical protein